MQCEKMRFLVCLLFVIQDRSAGRSRAKTNAWFRETHCLASDEATAMNKDENLEAIASSPFGVDVGLTKGPAVSLAAGRL